MSSENVSSEKTSSEKTSSGIKYKILVVDPKRCVGCEICESVCSMVHDGEFNPLNSRINRIRIEPIINSAFNCSSCRNPECIEACQPKALTKNPQTGLIEVDENKCDGCMSCMKACPWGAITVHTKTKKAITCDMCANTEEGTPQCVEYCPKDAIFIEEIDPECEEDPILQIKKLVDKGFPEVKYDEDTIIQRTPDLN